MSTTTRGNFFQRVMDENTQNNKDMNLSTRSKKIQNQSFTSIQKSLNKLAKIRTNNTHWSMRDHDPSYCTNGIGGKQSIFRNTVNLYTNDPSMYRSDNYNRSDCHT